MSAARDDRLATFPPSDTLSAVLNPGRGCALLFIYDYCFLKFYYFLLCWVFVAARGLGATLRRGARASHCSGFSCCGARALGARASVVVARGLSSRGSRALEHRLSSCGARA